MNAKELDIRIQEISSDLADKQQIVLHVARLDLIDPVISGNKIFKLHHFIDDALQQKRDTIVTTGGAYSNHLAATAAYCNSNHLSSIGLVRGDEVNDLSHTLQQCRKNKMELIFIDRKKYSDINQENYTEHINQSNESSYFIPEGGFHPLGAAGASIIMEKIASSNPTHIITAMGTATTLAGIVSRCEAHQKAIGISVLKGMNDTQERLHQLLPSAKYVMPEIIHDYHFGGYAKKSNELLTFMNELYRQYQIPTDFVYTGKMMFGVFDLIQKNHFPPGSNIVCLHTGGLQGNRSLPEGSLVF